MELSDQARANIEGVLRSLRGQRTVVSLFLYGCVVTVAYSLAFYLRFELEWPTRFTRTFWTTLPLLLGMRLSLARILKLTARSWRFANTQDQLRLLFATFVGSLFFFILTWQLGFPTSVPRSVIALEWVFTTYGTAGMWMAYEVVLQQVRRADAVNGGLEKKVLVLGAGEAGAMLVGEMVRAPTGFRAIGFVDDDSLKWGTTIHGVDVIGSSADLSAIVDVEQPDELIIAIPSATPAELNQIVEQCEKTNLTFKLLPGISEVLAGRVGLEQLRPVRIEDLLGREPIKLELPELADELRESCVLVTGAAGSIGSELSLQIALHRPAKLILLDQSETPLVDLDLDLRGQFPGLDLTPVVGDVTDASAMERLFKAHSPDQVFHAAAYKHVPMMEDNPVEAFRNNVVGTWIVARGAGEAGIGKFVLVSTDKAVRPVNLMGATKRLAELVILEIQERYPNTAFAAVRFGNVLGSNGSVIPLFRKQIQEGKPLTVTHPEITRFFMTIPEAVQLVLQASLLPRLRGCVAMLDMGEPVRIVDLARKVLRLSGRPARLDRDILFTGLRPGEKMHEELVAPDEETRPTAIERVKIVVPTKPHGGGLLSRLPIPPPAAEPLSQAAIGQLLEEFLPEWQKTGQNSLQEAVSAATRRSDA